MIPYYIQAFQKYAVFSGRASRSEYWGFNLVHILIVSTVSQTKLSTDQAHPELFSGREPLSQSRMGLRRFFQRLRYLSDGFTIQDVAGGGF